MRFAKITSAALLALASVAAPTANAETKRFFGVDTIETETELDYSNGSETYNFENIRLRYGWEDDAGGSFGFELISGDKDDTIDPFGTPFELETDPAIGFYATLGKPVYLKVGWSRWLTTYTNLVTDIADTETVDSYEIGLGINLLLGRAITFYADYTLKDTDSRYPKHFFGSGELDYESELVSVGFNVLF